MFIFPTLIRNWLHEQWWNCARPLKSLLTLITSLILNGFSVIWKYSIVKQNQNKNTEEDVNLCVKFQDYHKSCDPDLRCLTQLVASQAGCWGPAFFSSVPAWAIPPPSLSWPRWALGYHHHPHQHHHHNMVEKEGWPMRGRDLVMWSEDQWEASKKITWKGDIRKKEKQTSWLLDQLVPEGLVGENRIWEALNLSMCVESNTDTKIYFITVN